MANKQTRSSRNSRGPSKKNTRRWPTILKRTLLGLVILGCIAFLSGVGLFWYYAKDAPKLTDSALDSSTSSKLYTADGEFFEELGNQKREKISANEVPQQLEDAIVSVEDRRFYKHIGIDPIRIVGSFVSNITSGDLQGGSTLTQQLIKLSYFSTKSSDQTIKRKAQEAWLAVNLEKEKSKQEILTYYINKVYMANGLSGMETASETYYGKELSELSLAQTALIAGMPQAPSAYDPYAHPEQAEKRRNTVLYTMLENEKITKAEYEKAKAVDISDGLQPLSTTDTSENTKIVDNYVKEVIDEVEEKTGKNVYTDGLDIYTNLDLDAQKQLYEIVNSDQYVAYPDDEMQVASTLIDVNTGQVKAQIGARHVADDVTLGMNRAVNTSRDFGSTVKPITDYGPAYEYLKDSTGKTVVDEPYNYENTDPAVAVTNWDNQYMGTLTLRQALYLSRNVPAVKTFNEVGADNVSKFLKGLGIQYDTIHQANAISSNTSTQDGTKYGASSLKMAAAYAAFANGGTYYEPQYVNRVVYSDGTEDTYTSDGTKAMSEETAYMVTDVLKDTITKGTGTNAQIYGLYQAGKTGTSNYTDDEYAKIGISQGIYPDSLFVGYSPNYAISVWTGYDNKLTPVTSTSSHVASDVYRELMQYVSANVTNADWTMPSGLVRASNGELYYADEYASQVQQATTASSSTVAVEQEESESTSSSSKEASSSSTSSSSVEQSTSSSSEPESTTESSSSSTIETTEKSTTLSSSEEQTIQSSETTTENNATSTTKENETTNEADTETNNSSE
ncbi:MAG: PBP1A family penicillin-binding protein [Enterococcus sp.]